MRANYLSPDCEQGKHRACDEAAWDFEADELTECSCECHPTRRPLRTTLDVIELDGEGA